jgi:uncharacterized protein DUF6491
MTRWRFRTRIALLFCIAALLAACSSISLKEREQAELARIAAYAGQPVDHFTWLGRYDGWKPIGKEEALVWTSPDKAYLIKVAPCEDLRFASHIGLTSTLHTVYSRGLDYVRVRGSRCPIKQIRPVDYGRLQADLSRERPMEHVQSEEASQAERKTG